MRKLLVETMEGHDEMLDFLSEYRTRDHGHGDKKYTHEETKKYHPVGALFWFECNRYGEETGVAYFIHRVPVKQKNMRMYRDEAMRILAERMATPSEMKDQLCDDIWSYSVEEWRDPPWAAGRRTKKSLTPEARLSYLSHFGENLNWGDRKIPKAVRKRWNNNEPGKETEC